jgi:hypothetical protein
VQNQDGGKGQKGPSLGKGSSLEALKFSSKRGRPLNCFERFARSLSGKKVKASDLSDLEIILRLVTGFLADMQLGFARRASCSFLLRISETIAAAPHSFAIGEESCQPRASGTRMCAILAARGCIGMEYCGR